jgi:hypothetical protein
MRDRFHVADRIVGAQLFMGGLVAHTAVRNSGGILSHQFGQRSNLFEPETLWFVRTGFGIVSTAIIDEPLFADDATPQRDWHWFRVVYKFGQTVVYVPHWFLVLVSAMLATAPWIRWSKQFSLRTSLIAMTLFAVALGLVVAVFRWPAD